MMKVYTIIRSKEQYMIYCHDLEELTSSYQSSPSNDLLDLIDTVTLLIEQFDQEHSQLKEVDPIQLLKSLMHDNNLKQKDLVELLKVSKGHLSDILNYKKGLSKPYSRDGNVMSGISVNMKSFRLPGCKSIYVANQFLWGPGFFVSSAYMMSVIVSRILKHIYAVD